MYIRRVAEPDLIRLDLSATDEAGNSWAKDEWWRINSATGGSNPVEVEVRLRQGYSCACSRFTENFGGKGACSREIGDFSATGLCPRQCYDF